MLTVMQKFNSYTPLPRLNDNSIGKKFVDAVATVLNRDDTAASATRYHGDRLSLVATEREEKGVQLLIVGENILDEIFFSELCGS